LRSNDGLLAWAVDDTARNGSRFGSRIDSGDIARRVPGTLSCLVPGGDKGLVYSLANEQWRTDNARLHWLGQPISSDVELYHEDDEGFRVGAALSANEQWLILDLDHETSEVRLIPAADPLALRCSSAPRRVEYTSTSRGRGVHPHQRPPRELPPRHRVCRIRALDTLIEGATVFTSPGSRVRDFASSKAGRGLDRIELRSTIPR
jgi:oligopeptidase B